MGLMVLGPPRLSWNSDRNVIGMSMNSTCTLMAILSMHRNRDDEAIIELQIISNPGHEESSFSYDMKILKEEFDCQDMIFSNNDAYIAVLLSFQKRQMIIIWTLQEPSSTTQERYEFQQRPFISTTNESNTTPQLPSLARIPSHPRILTATTDCNITCFGYLTSSTLFLAQHFHSNHSSSIGVVNWRDQQGEKDLKLNILATIGSSKPIETICYSSSYLVLVTSDQIHLYQNNDLNQLSTIGSIECENVVDATFVSGNPNYLAILMKSPSNGNIAQVYNISQQKSPSSCECVCISTLNRIKHSLDSSTTSVTNLKNKNMFGIHCHATIENSHYLAISTMDGLFCLWDWYSDTLLWKKHLSPTHLQKLYFVQRLPENKLELFHISHHQSSIYRLGKIQERSNGIMSTNDSIIFYKDGNWNEIKVPLVHLGIEKAIMCDNHSAAVVSAKRGLAILDLTQQKWKLFPNLQQEESIKVHDFKWWNDSILLALVQYTISDDQQDYYIVAYPRMHLGHNEQLIDLENEQGWKVPHEFLLKMTVSSTIHLQLFSPSKNSTTAHLLVYTTTSSQSKNYYYYQLWELQRQQHSSNDRKIRLQLHNRQSEGQFVSSNYSRLLLASNRIVGIISSHKRSQNLFEVQSIHLTSSGPSDALTVFQSSSHITNYWCTTTTTNKIVMWTFTNQDSIVSCWALPITAESPTQQQEPPLVLPAIMNHEHKLSLHGMILKLQELDFMTRMDYSHTYFGPSKNSIMYLSQQDSRNNIFPIMSISMPSYVAPPLFLALAAYNLCQEMKAHVQNTLQNLPSRDAICIILHSTLHQLYSNANSKSSWNQIQTRLLSILIQQYHPLQLASLMARIGRQLEEHYLPYLFPLLPSDEKTDLVTINTLFEACLDHESYLTASSLLPLLPQQDNSHIDSCHQLLKHSLSCLLHYFNHNTKNTTCHEGISLLPQIVSYALKLEESSIQEEEDEDGFTIIRENNETSILVLSDNDDSSSLLLDSNHINTDYGSTATTSTSEDFSNILISESEEEQHYSFFNNPWKITKKRNDQDDDWKISKAASCFIRQQGILNSFSSSDGDSIKSYSNNDSMNSKTTVESILQQWLTYNYRTCCSVPSSKCEVFWKRCHFLAKLIHPTCQTHSPQPSTSTTGPTLEVSDSIIHSCLESVGTDGASLIYEFANTFGTNHNNVYVWNYMRHVTGIVSNQLQYHSRNELS